MTKRNRFKRDPRDYFIGASIAGVFLLLVSSAFLEQFPFWKEVVLGLAIAALTAGIIGGLIEYAFVSELTRDVFEVAFGYLLPKEIREEMKWIYSMNLLVTDYHHDFMIEKCDDALGKVWLRETITRTYENIGKDALEIKPSLGIEEWFHTEGRSEILSYNLTCGEKEKKEFSLEKKQLAVVRPKKDKQSSYILAIREDTVGILQPGESYTWVATAKEMRPGNDDTVSFFGTASKNPYITVKLPEDMDYDVTFANRKQGELRNLGSGHWRLDGLLLAGQAIRIRWWNKRDSEKWISAVHDQYPETKFD